MQTPPCLAGEQVQEEVLLVVRRTAAAVRVRVRVRVVHEVQQHHGEGVGAHGHGVRGQQVQRGQPLVRPERVGAIGLLRELRATMTCVRRRWEGKGVSYVGELGGGAGAWGFFTEFFQGAALVALERARARNVAVIFSQKRVLVGFSTKNNGNSSSRAPALLACVACLLTWSMTHSWQLARKRSCGANASANAAAVASSVRSIASTPASLMSTNDPPPPPPPSPPYPPPLLTAGGAGIAGDVHAPAGGGGRVCCYDIAPQPTDLAETANGEARGRVRCGLGLVGAKVRRDRG
jgi:hypothetical protein